MKKRSFSYIDSLPVLIILTVSVLVYINILPNGFVHDDGQQIIDNPWISDFGNLAGVFLSSAWAFLDDKVTSNYYRPIMHLVYMVDYYFFALDPWGYHLTSLIINSVDCLMVFFLIRLIITTGDIGRPYAFKSPETLAALCGALLFSVHPIHAESVAWAASIPELTFSFFFLVSFYLYITYTRGAGFVYYALSVFSFFLSALCKEPALTLPIVLVLYDFFVRDEPVFPLTAWIKRYLPFAVTGSLYIVLRIYSLSGFAPRGGAHELNTFENILNIFPLIFDYFSKLILPINQNFFYTFKPVHSVFEPRALLALGFMAILIFVLWRFYRTGRLVFFSILFIIMPLLPVLYIPAVGRNTFTERYLYLPSFGLVLIVAIALKGAFVSRLGESGYFRKAVVVSMSLVLILGAYLTVKRNTVYMDNFTLWSETLKESPDNGFVRLNLAIEYGQRGDDDMAIKYYLLSLKSIYLKVDATITYYNLANSYTNQGRFEEAIDAYDHALLIDPDYYRAYNNLGTIYARRGDIKSAIRLFRHALSIKPDFNDAKVNLQTALAMEGGR